MIAPTLVVLDRIVAISLWCFLGTLLVVLLFALTRLRRRRKRLGQLYADGDLDAAAVEPKARSLLNEWRILFHSVGVSATIAILVGLSLTFLPVPWVQNPVSGMPRELLPLRLTAVEYDRFYEGFSLNGEVWNQTEEPMAGLQAVVEVIGLRGETLAELPVTVAPAPLASGTAGAFAVEYRENSPFIKGYRLGFRDAEGASVPHTAGFDVP